MKYIIANWKCHKNQEMVEEWMQAVAAAHVIERAQNMTVVLLPSFLYLQQLQHKVEGLVLGAQTLSAYPSGAYTGAVSAEQLRPYVEFAMLGHVERRKHFGETNQVVAQQVREALAANITPIIAVDEKNWAQQLALLDANELKSCIVMYEPPDAIRFWSWPSG